MDAKRILCFWKAGQIKAPCVNIPLHNRKAGKRAQSLENFNPFDSGVYLDGIFPLWGKYVRYILLYNLFNCILLQLLIDKILVYVYVSGVYYIFLLLKEGEMKINGNSINGNWWKRLKELIFRRLNSMLVNVE